MKRTRSTTFLLCGTVALGGGGLAAEAALSVANSKTQVSGGILGGTARIRVSRHGSGNRSIAINAPGGTVNLSWCGLSQVSEARSAEQGRAGR